jgi:hypothetical protein
MIWFEFISKKEVDMNYVPAKFFQVMIGFLLSFIICSAASATPSIAPMRSALGAKQAGAEPLPQANPSALAMRFSHYMSGRWNIVGSGASGSKLFDGRAMVHPASGKKFLQIRYKTNQYAALDSENIKMKSRQAFMVLYFEAGDKFNLLSFRDSGKIKHFHGALSMVGKKYQLNVDSFKFGPLRAQVVVIIKPINKHKYAEHFYMNVLMPGSNKVMQQKLIANMVATKVSKSHKKKNKRSARNQAEKNPSKAHEKTDSKKADNKKADSKKADNKKVDSKK